MRRVSHTHADSFNLETLEQRSMLAADLVPGGITILSIGFASPGPTPQPFVFSVANMGDRRAPVGTKVSFYLSRDTTLDAQDRKLRDSVLPVAVRPGENVSFTKVLKFPQGVDDGLYRVIMKIDPDDRIAESDESNNALPTVAVGLYNQPRIEALEINKRYLRPGSAATLTARNVNRMDADAGQVLFYRRTIPGTGHFGLREFLGVGTRSGNDYTFSFVTDRAWLGDRNTFEAEAVKHSGNSYSSLVSVQGRNAGPSIGSFSFSPLSLVRGQTATLTASNLSSDVYGVELYFDSNFDGILQSPFDNAGSNPDRAIADSYHGGTTSSISFTVPDWFPSAPTRVFVVARRQVSIYQSATRVYAALLTAH